jgi:hypothetical protein
MAGHRLPGGNGKSAAVAMRQHVPGQTSPFGEELAPVGPVSADTFEDECRTPMTGANPCRYSCYECSSTPAAAGWTT